MRAALSLGSGPGTLEQDRLRWLSTLCELTHYNRFLLQELRRNAAAASRARAYLERSPAGRLLAQARLDQLRRGRTDLLREYRANQDFLAELLGLDPRPRLRVCNF